MRSRFLLAILLLQLAGCAASQDASQTAQTHNTPGWTGRTTVIGNNSSIADDAAATSDQQKWQRGRR